MWTVIGGIRSQGWTRGLLNWRSRRQGRFRINQIFTTWGVVGSWIHTFMMSHNMGKMASIRKMMSWWRITRWMRCLNLLKCMRSWWIKAPNPKTQMTRNLSTKFPISISPGMTWMAARPRQSCQKMKIIILRRNWIKMALVSWRCKLKIRINKWSSRRIAQSQILMILEIKRRA